MSARTPKTPEQRREEMEHLHAQLAEQVATLRTSTGWAAYLTAARTFTRYSVNNLLLIMVQCPEATQVAGYGAWQQKGRQVRRGEKAITILGSRVTRFPDSTQGDTETNTGPSAQPAPRGQQGHPGRRVFFPVRVFDITQTDPIEGAAPTLSPVTDLDADDAVDLYPRVAAHFARESITLRRVIVPGSANGFCRKIPPASAPLAPESEWVIEVVVDERRTGADAARTAVHEAAHIAAGHLEGTGEDYVAHRGRYEVEAESAAFIVAGLAGMDISAASTGYVASWMETAKDADLKATAATALQAARTLASALGLLEDTQHQDEAAAA